MGKLADALAPYLDRARDYYAQLSSRDQRALLVLSIFLRCCWCILQYGIPSLAGQLNSVRSMSMKKKPMR